MQLLLTHTSSAPLPEGGEALTHVPSHWFFSFFWEMEAGQECCSGAVWQELDWACLLIIHSLPEGQSVPLCLCWGHFSPSLPGLAGGLGAEFVIQIDE